MIELVLPYPPSVNHYKIMGRLKMSKNGKLYREMVNSPDTLAFYARVSSIYRQIPLIDCLHSTISVEIDVYPPDKRKRDLDGILKVLLDSLQRAQVFKDDYQIARLLVTRKTIIEHGQTIVRITEL